MFASAEVAFGFLLIFMLLTVAALIGTVILIIKGVFSLLNGAFRRLLGLPIRPRRYPGRRPHSFDPHSDRLTGCDDPRKPPAGRYEPGGANLGPGVYCGNDRCGHENRPNARFCARCGQPIGSRA